MNRIMMCLILFAFAAVALAPSGIAARKSEGRKAKTAVASPNQVAGPSRDGTITETGQRTTQKQRGTPRTPVKVNPQIQRVHPGGPSTVATAADSASYSLDAANLSMSAGIGDSSDSYRLDWMSGELALGEGESPSYTVSIGLFSSCGCPYQGDFEPDGFLTALDLAACIDILFSGAADIRDADCPSPRCDLDCDGYSTALDLAFLIDHLFAGGSEPCDPCAS